MVSRCPAEFHGEIPNISTELRKLLNTFEALLKNTESGQLVLARSLTSKRAVASTIALQRFKV